MSTDVQGHALDTLQDKLNEAESALRHQQDLYQRTQVMTVHQQCWDNIVSAFFSGDAREWRSQTFMPNSGI